MPGPSNPFTDLERLVEQMQDNFEQAAETWGMGHLPGSTNVRVDLEDTGDSFVLSADLPGFETDDIDVRLTDQLLHIEASHETEDEQEREDGNYIRKERRKQSITRSIRIPTTVESESITATYNNGVLTVTMPKATAEESGQQIDID